VLDRIEHVKDETVLPNRVIQDKIGEIIKEVCDILSDIVKRVNSLQREVDDWDNYRMEQNERK